MNQTDIRQYYGMLSFFPCKAGQKAATEVFWNYRKYAPRDIGPRDNLAMLAGTQVFRNTFSVVLDFDFDLSRYPKVLETAKQVCSDTVIVKSGGKHNGFHVHYLTHVPVKSLQIPKKNGVIEVKGIDENGRPEAMMLPPSTVNRKYEVIWPYKGDYIDFRKVRLIDPETLRRKLTQLNQII